MSIITVLILFVLFIFWGYIIKFGKTKEMDENFYQSINFTDNKILFYKIITNLANTKLFVLICLSLLLFLDNKRLALIITILMIINALIIFIFKHIFKRERPNIKRLVYEKGYSFPSGHMVSSISFYGFILMFIINMTIGLPFKIIAFIVLTYLIYKIGYSRIFLGVHYLSDIIGGVLIGSSYLLLYCYLIFNILNLL